MLHQTEGYKDCTI